MPRVWSRKHIGWKGDVRDVFFFFFLQEHGREKQVGSLDMDSKDAENEFYSHGSSYASICTKTVKTNLNSGKTVQS